MTLADVVNCAPFRLGQPRPLTPYEWTVVRAALEQGFTAAGVWPGDPRNKPAADALYRAVERQTRCPTWRTSAFGPAPAVATFSYECLGAWFSRLDPASQARALGDIELGGLLCSSAPPWSDCPHSRQMIGKSQADQWEGAAQIGDLRAATESCAWPRQRTSYAPMTGQQMLTLFRSTGGTLPLELEQLATLGAQFIQRDFLVGIQLRPPGPELAAAVARATTLLEVARAGIEEVALIWRPGRGESLRFLLEEPVDPAKITALVATMMPELAGEVLPGLLPGLLPWLFPTGNAQQFAARSKNPQTPPSTGYHVLDKPGSSLEAAPAGAGGALSPTNLMVGGAALLVVGFLAVALSRS